MIDYRNKKILAPMVRVGTLPFRLLARHFGADIVYSEELIDKRLLRTKRVVNEALGCVEYRCDTTNKLVWSTCPADSPTVLQIGTANAELAVAAAKHTYQDYDAFDVNMGCPKQFSVHGGMGSELLKDKEKIREILTSLTRNITGKPITCKIRLLDSIEDTIDLVKMIEQTGVAAVAVHARYIPQRPREPAHLHLLRPIVDAVSIPVIANGDMFTPADFERIRSETGCTSVMVGRGALWNASVFARDGAMKSQFEVGKMFVENCLRYENSWPFTKYTLTRMFEVDTKRPIYNSLVASKHMDHLLSIFEIDASAAATAPITEETDTEINSVINSTSS